jgi:hypothetical protein
LIALAALAPASLTEAACPPDQPAAITSGPATLRPPVFLGGLGGAPLGAFYALGADEENNSGTLLSTAWLRPMGDLDGDGLPEYRVDAPARGPGGWSDARTLGCPATLSPSYPPLVIVIQHPPEDLDGDGAFDVFEDFNRNGRLDKQDPCPGGGTICGEDLDGDGRLTPPDGCEGTLREDLDCDGNLDWIVEDLNGNGLLDPGEIDYDGDRHADPGTEDRNSNRILDDRPFPSADEAQPLYPYGTTRPAPGGILVAAVEWDGAAYNLDTSGASTRLVDTDDDRDGDGAFDVFEDFNRNGRLDKPVPCPGGGLICGEDRDGDGRLTPPGGCEGLLREDVDCDGNLDYRDEDLDNDGRLDPGENDFDADRRADPGTEDRNNNREMDDRPFPDESDLIFLHEPIPETHPFPGAAIAPLPPSYPYGRLRGGSRVRVLDATPLDPESLALAGIRLQDGTWQIRVRIESERRRRLLRPRVHLLEVPVAPGMIF